MARHPGTRQQPNLNPLLVLFSWLPLSAISRWGFPDRHRLDGFRSYQQSIEQELTVKLHHVEKELSQIEESRTQLRAAEVAWKTWCQGPSTRRDLEAELDTGMRSKAFPLAVHYWEARGYAHVPVLLSAASTSRWNPLEAEVIAGSIRPKCGSIGLQTPLGEQLLYVAVRKGTGQNSEQVNGYLNVQDSEDSS